MNKKLYAGFFAGEFGWNLMRWQAKIRKLAKNYDEVIIGCERDMRYLFEDYATSFVDFESTGVKIETRNMWMCNQKKYPIGIVDNADYILPSKEFCMNDSDQLFIKYGKSHSFLEFDVLIHARSTNNFGTSYRNWPIEKWKILVDELGKMGKKTACIGSVNGSCKIPGSVDCRGVALEVLSNIMASSKVLLSPSSGPVHFASLCGLKHVVWSDIKDRGLYNNKERYEAIWNPFNTPCTFIPKWQPTTSEVLDCIL